MQDEIIPPFCRFDSAKVLTDTVSVSTRGNVTVILSATLWTISPFALVCAIWPLARTRTSKCRSDWWRSKCPAPAEGGSRLQNANLVPGTTWRTFFLRRFQKLEVHFAPLNRHSNVECKMRLTASGFERQSDAQSCVLLLSPPPITPSFTTNEQAAMLY